mgnify:FL=1
MSDINKTNGSAETPETEKKPAEKKTAAKKTSEKKTAEKKTTAKKTAEKKTASRKTAEKAASKKAEDKQPEKKKVNEKLIEALAKWEKNPSRENLNAVMEEVVMTGKFLVPAVTAELTEEESRRVGSGKGRKMRFTAFTNAKGEKYFPAFTSPAQLLLWDKEYKGETAVLTFDDLCSVVGWNPDMLGFVVDPFGANLSIGGELCGQLKHKKDMLRKQYAELVRKNLKRQ